VSIETDLPYGKWLQGALNVWRVKVIDAATGLPKNLTGITLKFTVRNAGDFGSGPSVYSISGANITLANGDGTDDVAVVSDAGTNTAGLTPGIPYGFSLWDTTSPDPLARGTAVLTPVPQQ